MSLYIRKTLRKVNKNLLFVNLTSGLFITLKLLYTKSVSRAATPAQFFKKGQFLMELCFALKESLK